MLELATIMAVIVKFGYTGIFLGGFLGGEALLLAVGFLSKLGYFNVLYVIVWAVLGVVIWDTGWYIVGRKGRKRSMRLVKKFIIKGEENLEKTKKFFSKHSFEAIILARFVFGIRAVVFVLAGVLRMRFVDFMVANAIGTIIWATVLVLLGYFFGESYEVLRKYVHSTTLIVLILAVSIGCVYYLYNKLKHKIVNKIMK